MNENVIKTFFKELCLLFWIRAISYIFLVNREIHSKMLLKNVTFIFDHIFERQNFSATGCVTTTTIDKSVQKKWN